MTDLSIIIVSYNTRDLITACLDSIKETAKNISYEVFVIDNASSDDSQEVIKKYIQGDKSKKVFFVENDKNLGFSAANNKAMKNVLGRYILFLNPDTVVYPKTLDYMVKFMDENKKVGAATCELLMPNGKIDDASHRGFPTPWNSFNHFSGLAKLFPKSRIFSGYSQGWKELKKTHEVDALAGAFMIVRREAGDQAKWWDEDYFFYGEDLNFCYELIKHGWKIMYVPEVSILHYKGVSGGLKKVSENITKANSEVKKRATKARFDAMRIFYKKNYEDKYPKFLTKLVMLGISLKEKVS
jgi:GT2 family glycosyltransferase